MIEDVLLLALRLTFLLAVFGVAAVFHRCHRFVLKQSKLHLLPRIQRYSWALPPIEPSTANRFGLTKTRLKWVAGWYLSGLVIGVVVGLLLSFAGVFLLFWGFDTIDSLISGRRATGKHSGELRSGRKRCPWHHHDADYPHSSLPILDLVCND